MKYIIFSDVHSNLEALQAFRDVIRNVAHDKKVCLGDLVGYAADPNPVVEWVRENADIILAGNHDYAVVGKTDTSYFNPYAYQACVWTRRELTEDNSRFLSSLPVACEEDGIFWVHSSPFQPDQWHYVTDREDGEENFRHFGTQVCFLGHSHRPLILEMNSHGQIEAYVAPQWDIEPGHRYIFNAGSLGQPRDGNPDPSFLVYETDTQTVEFRRFKYDYRPTQEKILQNGLPYQLADRLSYGM